MFTLLMIVVCFLQYFGATKLNAPSISEVKCMRFYILGISDEIEVTTIVYDEATILAFKEMISLPFQSSCSFLSFPLLFWFWLR